MIAIGGYFFPRLSEAPILGSSKVGTQFGVQRMATVVFSPTTATTTSLFNSDVNERYITDVVFYCDNLGSSRTLLTGVGLLSAGFTFSAATTSNSTSGLQGNTNFVLNTSVATTTFQNYVASSTPGLTGTAVNRFWPAGTFLTYVANATNTAVCTINTDYIPS